MLIATKSSIFKILMTPPLPYPDFGELHPNYYFYFLFSYICYLILHRGIQKQKQETNMEVQKMVALVSRTGRDMQRYNFHGQRQVVGCIPYRYKGHQQHMVKEDEDVEEEIEVLVITSQRKGKGMLFPKGGWENDETIEDAALRETVEEAGVVGIVEHKLGKWNFESKNNDTSYEGHMFPLLVKDQLELWPEKEVRQRIWVSVKEARRVCQYWWMKEALELLVDRLTKPDNSGSISQARKSNL